MASTPPVHERAQEVLVQGLRFTPLLHFQVRFGHPFCAQIDSLRRAPLYVVGGRDCWLQWEQAPPLPLRHGDVVFLPRGGAHRVFSDPDAPPASFEELLTHGPVRRGAAYGLDVEGNDSVWSGSFYWSADLATHPLVASLPPVLALRADEAAPWLPPMTDLVRWMADVHAGGKGVGMTETVGALMQHLVLAWLRGAGQHIPAGVSAVEGLRDPRLMEALEAIHARPEFPWTLDNLAARCHMGRTAFATRFQAQMSMPPMRYLMQWRVHLAARMLREQRLPLQQVADAVGYSTGAILARAYKRILGVAPSLHE